jgi:transcriptional regulator with XRE-family HTH domain
MSRPNGRNPEEDPGAVFGEQLRILREDAGFSTQPSLGARIGYGQDAVSKVETGDRAPTDKMYLAWLKACGATPREKKILDKQLVLARKARGPIPQFIERWFASEGQASFLRLWGLLLVPGQLQTPEYARAMFLAGGYEEDEANEKVDIRVGRQVIFSRPEPAHATAVIHELALYFRVGTPEIMLGQLTHLLEMSKQRNVVIQVVRDFGYFPGLRGPYEIASGETIPDTLLMLAMEDQTIEDRTLTRKGIALFEDIRSYALNAEESRAVILEAIEGWKRRQQ